MCTQVTEAPPPGNAVPRYHLILWQQSPAHYKSKVYEKKWRTDKPSLAYLINVLLCTPFFSDTRGFMLSCLIDLKVLIMPCGCGIRCFLTVFASSVLEVLILLFFSVCCVFCVPQYSLLRLHFHREPLELKCPQGSCMWCFLICLFIVISVYLAEGWTELKACLLEGKIA